MYLEVSTRPVRPDDDERFRRLWPRLSPETVYRRFHAPVRRLPAGTLRRLVDVDHDDREAVVALVGDEVVGVARYERSATDPARAEVAVLVEDAWQGAGIGRRLLLDLTELAGRRGIRTSTATVQADNDSVLALVRRLAPRSRLTVEDDVVVVETPLPSTAPVPTG